MFKRFFLASLFLNFPSVFSAYQSIYQVGSFAWPDPAAQIKNVIFDFFKKVQPGSSAIVLSRQKDKVCLVLDWAGREAQIYSGKRAVDFCGSGPLGWITPSRVVPRLVDLMGSLFDQRADRVSRKNMRDFLVDLVDLSYRSSLDEIQPTLSTLNKTIDAIAAISDLMLSKTRPGLAFEEYYQEIERLKSYAKQSLSSPLQPSVSQRRAPDYVGAYDLERVCCCCGLSFDSGSMISKFSCTGRVHFNHSWCVLGYNSCPADGCGRPVGQTTAEEAAEVCPICQYGICGKKPVTAGFLCSKNKHLIHTECLKKLFIKIPNSRCLICDAQKA